MFNTPYPRGTGDWTVGRRIMMAATGIALLACGSVASAGKPELDQSYAEGQIYWMIGPRLMEGVATTNPNLYAQAEELYLVVYPLQNDTNDDHSPKTLNSGYQPQCDPCYHPGLPAPFVYHDHVLAGAPGLGNHGTANANKGPWKIILVEYRLGVILDLGFTPAKSVKDILDGEMNGDFQVINPGADNPYEIDTGNVLICPLVSPSA